jgi:hypothetical protein
MWGLGFRKCRWLQRMKMLRSRWLKWILTEAQIQVPSLRRNTWKIETSKGTWGRKLPSWPNYIWTDLGSCTASLPATSYPLSPPSHLLWTLETTRFIHPFLILTCICKVVACLWQKSSRRSILLASSISCWVESEDFRWSRNMQRVMFRAI